MHQLIHKQLDLIPPYGTLPKFLRARKETIFGRGLTLLELNLLFRHAETYHDLRT